MTANPLAPFAPSNEVNHKTETPVSPAKSENKVEAKNVCELNLKVRNREELLAELSGFSDNLDLWYLTYMLHTGEHFMLAEAKEKEEGKLKFDHNRFGFAKNAINRLENMTKSKMKSFSDTSWHEYTWFIKMDKDNRPNVHALCSVCKDKLDFCPHKMTAYIEHVCLKLGLDKEEIYRCILGKRYSKKSDFDVYEELSDIPVEEYGFIDAVSATAAAELLKMNLMRVSAETDDRILYSYLPLCEKTKHSFISDAMAFYRSGQGKTDFVYKEDFRSQLDENRNCPDCIFPQCPDKVALYLLVLADRYSVNVMKLARFVIEKNRLGMSANGFFNYYEQTKELEKIPLTPESRKTVHNIIKYTINKFYVDKVVPFIPFNMAIYTRDELQADQLVKILKEMFNFYHYWDKKAVVTECRFSSVSLTGLIETIAKITNPTILHLKEFDLLSSVEAKNPTENVQLKMAKLVNTIREKNQLVFIIVSGEKNRLDSVFNLYGDFYNGLLSYKLTVSDMSATKVVQTTITELEEQFQLEEGFQNALEQYVLAKYGESDLKSRAFIDLLKQTITFNHFNHQINIEGQLLVRDIPGVGNRRSREEVWGEINSLTGLESVKEEIRTLEQLLKFNKKTSELGMRSMKRPNMHMVFAGNPGTGKTTVARIIAELLYNIGYIKQNKLVEVSPKDLIGQYIGHTAPKTAAVCESAYDGVLFIDEAYELTSTNITSGHNFRSECITELIKQMEDNRDRLIVIFAGYTEEMQEFLQSNAGFTSRIGRFIEFEDYTTEQLCNMFRTMVSKNGLRLSEKAAIRAEEIIESARNFPHFGNGRYVRNLFEKVLLEHAKNTFNIDDAETLATISEEDFPSK